MEGGDVPTETAPLHVPGEGPLQQHPSLASAAQDWITDQILRGRIMPGEKLAEVALAQQMGISRSPVREALRALSAQGLIIVEPRRGAFVAEMDAKQASDLYVCRLLIEPECVRQAVDALTDATLSTLQDIFGRMQTAADNARYEAYVGALTDYNQELLEACPNRILFGHAESTWRSSLRYWGLMVRHSGTYSQQSLRRNRNIHRAVSKRDGQAAAVAVTALLEWSRNELLSIVTQLPSRASEQPPGSPREKV
jgi:GntR family transcriptional regulator, rspAB operon transcriptional repressor